MFGRAKEKSRSSLPRGPQQDAPAAGATAAQEARPGGKGRPTPRRQEAQARNRKPLVPTDRKAARQAARQAVRADRARMQQALLTGDERYLPLRDKGPQKRLARDLVDSRRNVGELFLVVAVGALLLSVVTQSLRIPELLIGSTLLIYAMLLAVVVDSVLLGRRIKREAAQRFGHVEPGVVGYGITRALQIRRLRRPVPGVERGQAPR